ncbi:hypothetical protein KC334_g15717 [Hortaea werneckii]|nr:hypothetical protein KC334_g15717 [Hortaea werneckii]
MRDQSLQTQEHKSHSSRSSAAGEEDRDSTAEPRSPASLQMPGAKKTAADDVLALVSTNPGNTSSNIGDIESGAEHKEEPDSLSPRNTSHAEGLVIESAPQDEVHYATMSWWHTALAETVSLGILSLPSALATLGYVPGVLLILTLGLLSWYTGTIIFHLKMRHFDSIHSYADIFALWLGRPGRWSGEVATNLMLVFIVAAHIVTFSVMMNVLTEGKGMWTSLNQKTNPGTGANTTHTAATTPNPARYPNESVKGPVASGRNVPIRHRRISTLVVALAE